MSDTQSIIDRRKFIQSTGVLAGSSLVGGVAGAKGGGSEKGPVSDKRVVGYYPSWAGEYAPRDVPYDKLTHLNYAFLEPESNGEVKLAVEGDYAPEVLETFEEVTHEQPDTSFLLSIQAGWYSGRFSDAALTAERRERFARTAIEQMRTYNFDGIDIDWEYPDGSVREEDPQNLTKLLAEIRSQFDDAEEEDDRTYELSMAVSANTAVSDPLEVEKFADDVDFLNVMTYDFHGTWDSRTHFNAPLYPVPDAPNSTPTFTADYAMQYWGDRAIPKEKIHFGLPFYGRTYENVENEDSDDKGLFQPFDGGSSRTFADIQENVKSDDDYQYHWHPEARVPWLYSEADDVFIAYDDKHSVMEKTKYAVDHGFGGMMCWELSQDPTNTLLETIDRHISHP
ncbi:glycoside hydrolase family 18 protein [Halorussus amylolyticus]|uniref:glycoside hydrolase family 18 protein n=1 Tax=Halorussus amylolyticus TaxID=1126242 RepID=UPI0010476AAA|nr:glycoside hydrolase family 18 protein [Halorussus amylolyticus]